jgi:acyl carrier protein
MVFEKIRKILADQLEIEENMITIESNLVDELNADSLDIVELIMDLEQEFDISIPDEDLPKVSTVNDIVSYIENQLA